MQQPEQRPPCYSCGGPAHPCDHPPFDRCEHCVENYWPRVRAVQERLWSLRLMQISEPLEVEAWVRLLATLIIEAADLGLTLNEIEGKDRE